MSVATYVPPSSKIVGSSRSKYGYSTTSRSSSRTSLERPQHRMAFPDEQPPARPQQVGDDRAQRRTVGSQHSAPMPVNTKSNASPAERVGAPRRRRTRRTWRRPRSCAASAAGLLDRGRGEVHARSSTRRAWPARSCRCRCGTAGARRAARRCRRAWAGRTAPPRLRNAGSARNSLDAVIRRGDVRGHPLIPVGPVHGGVVLHGS